MKALEKDLKKTKMSDTGIVNLLFSPAFFRVSGHTSLYCECENTWADIWNLLTEGKGNTDWIPACVVSQLKLAKSDLSYLHKINDWVHEIFNINPQDLDRYIKSGLLEETLEGILAQYSSASNEFITDFFISLKSIISICDISPVSTRLVTLMLQESLIYDAQVSELALTCLAILMRQQELGSFKKFLIMLKKAENFETQKILLEGVQNILNDSESRKWCQDNFVEAGIFEVIKEILEKSYLEDKTESIWDSCMECVRFVIQGNDGKGLEVLGVKDVAKMLIGENFKVKRVGVSERIVETLLLILFGKSTVETVKEIVNPEIIPLVITAMCIQFSGLCKIVVNIVKVPYNAAIFSLYSALEFLVEGLVYSENCSVLGFIADLISDISTFHVTPVVLKRIFNVSVKLTGEKQKLLFRSINKGFGKSFLPNADKLGYSIEPNHFIWFINKSSRVECSSNDLELLPKKDFSILTWAFVPKDAEGCIWELFEKRSKLCLELNGYSLILSYVQEKKTVFSIKTTKCLTPGSWNLICVSSQQIAKLMGSATNIDLIVNRKQCEKSTEGKLTISHNFHSLFIGNNSDSNKSFQGKITFCVILNKSLTDLSPLLDLDEDMYLGFIPESISAFKKIDQKLFKDLSKSKHFEYFSYKSAYEPNISVTVRALQVQNGNTVHSLAAIGGLQIFFPLIKENSADQSLILALLSLISTFMKTRSLASIISKDFFEVLGDTLGSYLTANQELLNITSDILENIDWDIYYQKNVFTYLLCNPSIWINMNDELLENYLKVISTHVSKHFECNLTNVTYLYSHLIQLNPVPGLSFVKFFSKILAQCTKLVPENLEATTFLLFRIIRDCPQIMESFLEELSSIQVDRKCAQELAFLVLHIMDWVQKFQIQSGGIRVLKTVVLSLVGENKEKKTVAEFCRFILVSVDQKLNKNISLEVFQSLMDVVLSSFTYGLCKEDTEIFEMFTDLITKRFSQLGDKVREELNKATTDYQFCDLIIRRENFPAWLFESYLMEKENTIEFSLNLFRHACNKVYLLKLRQFLLEISKIELNEGIKFYHRVLLNLKNFGYFETIACFLDFSSILEDLINTEISGRQELCSETLTAVISSLIDHASILSLIQCSYPSLPKIDFSTQLDLFKQRPLEVPRSEISLFLRDGGFLRLILKYILIGLQLKSSSQLISLLKSVLTCKTDLNSIIFLDSLQKQASEKILIELNPDIYSSAYSKFPGRETDSLFSEEFLSFYLLVEVTEILSFKYDEELFEFFLKFVQETCIDRWLVSWSKRITSKELEDFYKLTAEYKFSFFATARSRFPQMERNGYLGLMSTVFPQSLTTFQFCICEQAEALGAAKKVANSLKELLANPAWVSKVHFFLLAYTSMKLNFIASIAKHSQCQFPPESPVTEDFSLKLTQYISSKQEELKAWQMTFSQLQDKFSSLYKQKFKVHCNSIQKLEKLFLKGRTKLRWVFDGLGRMPICVKQKSKERFTLRRSQSVTVPVEYRLKASVIASTGTESSVGEESETGTLVNGVEEEVVENIPIEQQKILKIDCERIKVTYSLYGDLEVCSAFLLFVADAKEKPTDPKYFGSALKFTQEVKKSTKFIEAEEVSEIFARRFIHKQTAFELFLKDGRSFYFNVFTPESRNEVFEIFKSWRGVKVVTPALCAQYLRGYTKKWRFCEISNFEYLMIVNKCASRSFNDMSQYPVFPWVLKEYLKSELKLDDEHVYRDFKLPIGAQTQAGKQEADRRFSMWIDEQPYHFGSHYSSGAIVLYYLVRIEPFTTQAKILQGGKFDIADRLFHSIQACWESGQGVNGDVKELIPELFYLPEMFLNVNEEDFGSKQDEEAVKGVEIPKWAENPVDFVRKHRAALESNYVSSVLNHWIDLIFGFKQKGKQAQNSYNLFCPMTYGDNFIKIIEKAEEGEGYMQGLVDQVVHFGQTPIRIFKKPHPMKEIKQVESSIFDKYKKFSEGVYHGCETNGLICALLMTSKYLIIVKNVYARISIFRINLNEIEYNRVVFDDRKEKILLNCMPVLTDSPEYFSVFAEKRIVSVYHEDNSFRLHTLNGNLDACIIGHTDLVTCVQCSKAYIITGSKDSSLISWEPNKDKSIKLSLKVRFFGHDSELTSVRVLENYQILFSLAKNGKILLHDLRSGECLKGILTDALGFDVSSLGVISYFTSDYVHSFTINSTFLSKKQISVKKLIFDNSGENLYYYFNTTWGFFNLFEGNKAFEKDEKTVITHIQLPLGNEYFVFSKIAEKLNNVFTFELIRKDTFKVIRKHNIFQDY